MANENGEWVSRALRYDAPGRLKTPEELIALVEKDGFLPLFANGVEGFSVEERTLALDWWIDDPARDPWEWRKVVADGGKVAYGKFFGGKAGFVSLEWLPFFANWRRDGYDFDALWSDGKVDRREKLIMDLFADGGELYSNEIRRLAGFGKGGAKNFEGALTALQHKFYLTVRDFRQRRSRGGEPYGWPIAVYSTPESRWGHGLLSSAYSEPPERSRERVFARVRDLYPNAAEKQIKEILK
ncbi:MAG: hypothetical protein IJL83_04015 [Clostridia bacterium]|nr:hypothetical protein [Clostridia bacterium]